MQSNTVIMTSAYAAP